MIEVLLVTLIYIAIVIGAVLLVRWVLIKLGVPIPQDFMNVVWVVVVLVILLILWRAFGGYLPGI